MDEQRARIVELVKRLPGCATVDAALLDLYAGAVQQCILDYCNRDDVPTVLERTAALMVRDMLQAEGYLAVDAAGKTVKSIARGDTNITYQTASANQAAADQAALFLKDHRLQLDRWRKMRMPGRSL